MQLHSSTPPVLSYSTTPVLHYSNIMQQEELSQMQGHLYTLVNQVEQMQWELARLSREAQQSNSRMTALTRHIIYAEAQKHLYERLAEFTTQIETSQEKIEDLAEPQQRIQEKLTRFFEELHAHQEQFARLSGPQQRIEEKLVDFMNRLEEQESALNDLTRTVKKMSRTQFKANALGETKEQQVNETLSLLRELATKRDELTQTQQQEEQKRIEELKARARGDLAADMLPVLDGIEMALEHGLPISQHEETEGSDVPPEKQTGFFRKFFTSSAHAPTIHSDSDEDARTLIQELQETTASWLRGLEIVRERFLRLLEDEGIARISDVDSPFDPHLHVAVDTEERTDVAENTITAVIRKGYTQHQRVLRYAEVIVAKSPQTAEQPEAQEDTEEDERKK